MQMATTGTGHLQVGTRHGELRHFLRDEAVEHGEVLEVLLRDGTWLRGAYIWSGRPDDPPRLLLVLGGPWTSAPNGIPVFTELAVPPDAVLRWPDDG